MKNEKKWEKIAFSDAFEINPKVDLVKGRIYPFINMDAVNQNNRNVFRSEYREYTGSGSKYISDDTLMARITPCLENGKIAGYKSSEKEEEIAFGSTEFIVIRGKKGLTDNTFAYYVTRWMKFRKYAIAQMTGSSGRQRVPVDSLKGFSFYLPPLPTQEQIADILSTLDNKIELNQQMNQTLENIARAIFKSWFVDFDPVYAKMEGRDYPLPADIMDLFPDELVESELGVIPKGWKIQPLSEIINLIGGGTPKTSVSEFWNGNIPWFSVNDVPDESDIFVINTKNKITEMGLNSSSTHVLRFGTTIISARGSVGKCAMVGTPMAMNQSCYGIQGKEGFSDNFIYFLIRSNVSDFQKRGHGSVFNTITKSTFESIDVIIPDINVVQGYQSISNIFLLRILNNVNQNQILSKTRDNLLPKLINGEIKI